MRMDHNVSSWGFVSVLMSGMALGFGVSLYAMPMPKAKDDCGIYKINRRTVTSFVLKAPDKAPQEHFACPVAPKCEAQVTNPPENVSQAETNNVDERKPRRHRRHYSRVRATWR